MEKCTDTVIRVKGYAFVFDHTVNEFTSRSAVRTRVFGLTSAGLIIAVLPETVDLETLRYGIDSNGKRVVTDDQGFEMNINEFGASR